MFYPESAPENWEQIIDDWRVPCLLSPLHDKDTFKSGNVKKPHYHLFFAFDNNQPYERILGFAKQLGVNYAMPGYWEDLEDDELQRAGVRRSEERYLCHLDSRNKWHYPVEEVIPFGGYEIKYLDDEFDCSGISRIISVIESNGIVYFADLACELIKNNNDLVLCLMRYQAFFNNYLYSRERMVKNYSNDKTSYVKYAHTRVSWIGD